MTTRDDERRKFEAWCPIKITDVTKAPKAAVLKAAYWTAWEACAELARAEQVETPRAASPIKTCRVCRGAITLTDGDWRHIPLAFDHEAVSVEETPRVAMSAEPTLSKWKCLFCPEICTGTFNQLDDCINCGAYAWKEMCESLTKISHLISKRRNL